MVPDVHQRERMHREVHRFRLETEGMPPGERRGREELADRFERMLYEVTCHPEARINAERKLRERKADVRFAIGYVATVGLLGLLLLAASIRYYRNHGPLDQNSWWPLWPYAYVGIAMLVNFFACLSCGPLGETGREVSKAEGELASAKQRESWLQAELEKGWPVLPKPEPLPVRRPPAPVRLGRPPAEVPMAPYKERRPQADGPPPETISLDLPWDLIQRHLA